MRRGIGTGIGIGIGIAMKTVGALLWDIGRPWSVEEIDIGDPARGEVLVQMEAAGLCHCDHQVSTGSLPTGGFPVLGGHEGAGVVVGVGPDVRDLSVGDHVVLSSVPSCGACAYCTAGRPLTCVRARLLPAGRAISDSSFRVRARGREVYPFALLGAFSPYTVVHRTSVIPVDPDIPFDIACLLSCAIATGWGAVTRAAGVRPGEDVAVIGLGGVGMAALRIAVAAGARHVFGIDPVEWKRSLAVEWGAHRAYPDLASATAGVAALTGGLMSAKVIVATGQPSGGDLDAWMSLTSKGGTCVLASVADVRVFDVTVNLAIQTLMQKRLQGTLCGDGDLHHDVRLLASMHRTGRLDLGGFVTRQYRLADINEGYRDLLDGRNVRGVIRYSGADRAY